MLKLVNILIYAAAIIVIAVALYFLFRKRVRALIRTIVVKYDYMDDINSIDENEE